MGGEWWFRIRDDPQSSLDLDKYQKKLLELKTENENKLKSDADIEVFWCDVNLPPQDNIFASFKYNVSYGEEDKIRYWNLFWNPKIVVVREERTSDVHGRRSPCNFYGVSLKMQKDLVDSCPDAFELYLGDRAEMYCDECYVADQGFVHIDHFCLCGGYCKNCFGRSPYHDEDMRRSSWKTELTTDLKTAPVEIRFNDKMACAVCKKEGNEMMRCGACKSVAYCDSKCQKQDWKTHKNACTLFKICDDPISGGQGWIATRDIKAGTIILDELPAFSTTGWNEDSFKEEDFIPNCIVCGLYMELDKGRRCATCKWPICSKLCEAMVIHGENECQFFQKMDLPFPPPRKTFQSPTDVQCFITMLRGVGLKSKNKIIHDELMKLQFQHNLPAAQEQMIEISKEMEVMLRKFIPKELDGSVEDYLKIFYITHINGYNAPPTERIDEGGNRNSRRRQSCGGVYIKASRINHSCIPNLSWLVGPAPYLPIRIRAAVDIKKGEPLTVAYREPDLLLGTLERQLSLKKCLGFICKCRRCVDNTELGSFLSGIKCLKCNGEKNKKGKDDAENSGYFLPQNPLDLTKTAIWKCNSCGMSKIAKDILEPVDDLIQQTEMMMSDKFLEFAETTYRFMETTSFPLFHKDHFLIQRAKRVLINRYVRDLYSLTVGQINKCVLMCSEVVFIMEKTCLPGLSYHQANLWRQLSRVLCVRLTKYGSTFKDFDALLVSVRGMGLAQEKSLTFFESARPNAYPVEVEELKKEMEIYQSFQDALEKKITEARRNSEKKEQQ